MQAAGALFSTITLPYLPALLFTSSMEQAEDYDIFKWPDLEHTLIFGRKAADYESTLFHVINLDRQSRERLVGWEANANLVPPIKLEHPYAPAAYLEPELQLPDLESLQSDQLEDLESSTNSTLSNPQYSALVEDEDVWKIAFELGPANRDVALYSWETFQNSKHEEPKSAYISEAGPSIFDAVQAEQSPDKAAFGNPLDADVLLRSLYQVGLGRSSILFSFNKEKMTFVPVIQKARSLGCTLELSQNVVDTFITCGTLFRKLNNFSNRMIAQGSGTPAKLALANVVHSVLFFVEEHLNARCPSLRSLLQLQEAFAKPISLLQLIQETIEYAEDSNSSEELISRIFRKAEEMAESGHWLNECVFNIFCLVCKPWLHSVERWIGLRQAVLADDSQPGNLPDFVGTGDSLSTETNESDQASHVYKEDRRPDFIPPEDTRAIFEAGKAFCILRTQHPAHPLISSQTRSNLSQHFEWISNLNEMQRIMDKANSYEVELKATIRKFDSGEFSRAQTHDKPTETDCERDESSSWADSEVQSHWLNRSIAMLDAPPSKQLQDLPSALREMIHRILAAESLDSEPRQTAAEAIPLSLIPSLSLNPLVYAQANLIHAATLRLLFHSHKLRSHLSVLHAYHLLGNGSFLTQLTNALFSSELASAERRRGAPRIGKSMGLHLGSRATWPPASSELRLVLMGILSDSYNSFPINKDDVQSTPSKTKDQDLPGGLSFAVRQLSEDELEKCIQPDSLHALDFLRLHYIPPQPLDVIITTKSLQKYDTIFKFLLRVVRMQWVINQHCNPFTLSIGLRTRNQSSHDRRNFAARFQFEANHVISSLATHFFNIGVSVPWHRFDAHIHDLERQLGAADYLDHHKMAEMSIPAVRQAHEAMLDGIMTVLFLRKRQASLMGALEGIFDTVLEFASFQRSESPDRQLDKLRGLYVQFRRKVRSFLAACRQAHEKESRKVKSPGLGSAIRTLDEPIEMLLLQLCMNMYYEDPFY